MRCSSNSGVVQTAPTAQAENRGADGARGRRRRRVRGETEPGALKLRRVVDELRVVSAVDKRAAEHVKKMGNGDGSTWVKIGIEGELTGVGIDGGQRRLQREPNGDGGGCVGF